MYKISTHTPLAGRDACVVYLTKQTVRFLLTRPSRGATVRTQATEPNDSISTHTPLAGRDSADIDSLTAEQLFLLTRPSRGATTSSPMM